MVLPDYPDTVYNTDLVRFTPDAPIATTDNEGMALAGTPVFVTVSAVTNTQTGTLLGYPVTVTFSPMRTSVDFGDGTSASSEGATAVFEHSYAARGTYATTQTADYAATVTFSDGVPRSVVGTITSTVPGPSIRILTARTGLVRDTCDTAPDAAGC